MTLRLTQCHQNWLTMMVRVTGVEPARLSAREPKGYVTLVKDFQSPPYRKGRTSFQRFKRYFGRDRPNIC